MTGSPQHRAHASHFWGLVIGIVISIVCLGAALGGMLRDREALAQIGTAFATANYISLLPYWAALTAFYLLKAWRWRLLLQPLGDFHTTRDLLPPVMIGFAFNNVLPAHLGDFVRVFVFARQQRLPSAAVLSSVVLERVFDIIAVLFVLGGGLLFVPQLDPGVQRTSLVFAGISAVGMLGAIGFVIWTKPFVTLFEAILGRLPFIPAGLRAKLTGMLEASASGLASLKQPRLLLGIVASSFAQWLLNAALVHMSLWSFGIHVTPAVSCLVVGVTAFGVTVPSSPGYFGVIQLCFMTVLKLFVDNQPAVFAASVYYHLAQYIPVTLIGL
ncbi:MAG TPA: lysylphosphatidylglycerol synthase transmembrane domain-containing protein, partial [Planctomycetaceae bacterium]|nr:lysylphosphatidylglycerol synthase transmembrane domain-containing protein [Planctomycetaceae bacterium]